MKMHLTRTGAVGLVHVAVLGGTASAFATGCSTAAHPAGVAETTSVKVNRVLEAPASTSSDKTAKLALDQGEMQKGSLVTSDFPKCNARLDSKPTCFER